MNRSKHKFSPYRNTTFNMGELVPVGCFPVVRGETWRHNTKMFMRVNPLVNPVMHPVRVQLSHFYVPNPIVFPEWRDFISGGEDNDDTTALPTKDFSGSPVAKGDLMNHLGLPPGANRTYNILRARAYNLIYNEIYRDDQLQAKVAISLDEGADTTTSIDLQNANWDKDPFTSARPGS